MISESLNFCFGFQFKLDKNKVPKILDVIPGLQLLEYINARRFRIKKLHYFSQNI